MNVRPKAENERSEWVNGGAKHRNELTEAEGRDVFGEAKSSICEAEGRE
jgi:hypothetical protein